MKIAFIGTYTKKEDHVNGEAEGIYTMQQDTIVGSLKYGEIVALITNPSFLIVSADNKNLYAISEIGEKDAESGFVYSYLIGPDNGLEEIGKISTEGFAPCFVAEDREGNLIFVANYEGGVITVYEKKSNGSLEQVQSITLQNPDNSHPHSINICSNNKHVYIPDLGNDKVWIFDLNTSLKKLIPNEMTFVEIEEGSGPRHFSFSITGKYAYTVNEFNSSISVYKVLEGGGLEEVQNIQTVPDDFHRENTAADLHLHPTGKFLYASNRGHNSIVVFSVDETIGELQTLGYTPSGGEAPRNFSISKDGKYLYVANQDSNNIVSFSINIETGKLSPLGSEIEVKTPVCISFKN